MSFLSELWAKLDLIKENNPEKQSAFKQIYKGYRTVFVQKLDRKACPKRYSVTGQQIWNENKKILTYKENAKLTHRASNGFWSAFYEAYMNHGDIKIKPDEVWLIIMLWFTKYVDDNAEQLRRAFVNHEGKKKIVVRTQSADETQWDEFFEKVIIEIRKNTNEGVTEKLQCDFSSTGVFQRLFSTAIVMNSFKKYFDYERMGGGCGINNVHMAGNLEDWQRLIQKLNNLEQYDVNGRLKKYVKGLRPVLEQFVQTYKGNAHLQFWNNVYIERKNPTQREYMPSTFINGWLIKFFTIRDEITQQEQVQEIAVDIKFINLQTNETKMLKMIGGCKGYCVTDDYVYQPHYSFAIAEMKMKPGMMKEYVPKVIPPKQTLKISKINVGFQEFKNVQKSRLIHTKNKIK